MAVRTAAAVNVATTLRLALQHEQDLDTSAASFVAGNPVPSASAFRDWVASEQAFERFPELDSIAAIATRAGSPTRRIRGPTRPQTPPGPPALTALLVVVPAGARASYCLETGSVTRPGFAVEPCRSRLLRVAHRARTPDRPGLGPEHLSPVQVRHP